MYNCIQDYNSLDINTLIFNRLNSLNDLGVGVQSYPSFPMINEEYEEYKVEGRSGSLIQNKGTYPDIKITFDLVLIKFDDFWQSMDRVEEWLNNIEDNTLIYDRKDICYKVKKVIKGNIKREAYLKEGEFKVTFLCEPFKYDVYKGDLEITENNTEIYYEGTINTLPLIKVWGSGEINLTLNNQINIENISYIEIDSNLKQVRNADGTSKDMNSNGYFPYLKQGENIIGWTGNISKIEIEFDTLYK